MEQGRNDYGGGGRNHSYSVEEVTEDNDGCMWIHSQTSDGHDMWSEAEFDTSHDVYFVKSKGQTRFRRPSGRKKRPHPGKGKGRGKFRPKGANEVATLDDVDECESEHSESHDQYEDVNAVGKGKSKGGGKGAPACWICKKTGHRMADCKDPRATKAAKDAVIASFKKRASFLIEQQLESEGGPSNDACVVTQESGNGFDDYDLDSALFDIEENGDYDDDGWFVSCNHVITAQEPEEAQVDSNIPVRPCDSSPSITVKPSISGSNQALHDEVDEWTPEASYVIGCPDFYKGQRS